MTARLDGRKGGLATTLLLLVMLCQFNACVPGVAIRPTNITTTTVHPDMDAVVFTSNTSANGGSTQTFYIGRIMSVNHSVYVHFNLSFTRTNLVSMVLDTITSDPSSPLDLHVWRVQDDWTEHGITWDTRPEVLSHVVSYMMPGETPDDGTDITGLVNGTTPVDELSLCFNATTSDLVNYIMMNSREAPFGAPGAYIVCMYDDGMPTPSEYMIFIIIGSLAGIVVLFCVIVDRITRPKKKPGTTSMHPSISAPPSQPQSFAGTVQAPAPYRPITHSTARFCSDCGAPFESDGRFCSNCGKPRDEE